MDSFQHSTSNAPEPKRNIRITMVSNDLQKVRKITQLMTKEAQVSFTKRYGQILDLLTIPTEAPMLSALAQFWNSHLRCFELPNLDIVPTIEEYVTVLGLPINEGSGVYLYKGRYVEGKKIMKMIGMQASQVGLEKRGSTCGLKRTLLEDHLEALAKQGDWGHFNPTLALVIYGMVLFPFTPDMVDQAAMDVFHQYEEQVANPIPAILADTLLSIDICHRKRGGTLKCCSHLLYVWIVTHMYARNHMGLFPNPLRDFLRIPVRQLGAREWKEEFFKVEANKFIWACPWYHPKSTILSCGSFPNVPLMGPRGCVAYTPAVVLRQLKWTQVKPREEQFGGLSFQYDEEDTVKQQTEVRDAWKSIQKMGEKELGKPKVIASTEYKEWRMERGTQAYVPRQAHHSEGPSQEAI